MAAVTIRAATPQDIASIAEIHAHYVLNTVITFAIDVLSIEQQLEKLQKVQAEALPYLVAVTDATNDDAGGDVVGFGYLSGFRGGKAGYRHTVELSLYCHVPYQGCGVGSKLLRKLLDIMERPGEHSEEFLGGRMRPEDRRVRQIMAVMAVDTFGRREGLALKEYYERFGFELQGHLKQVGHKLGRWYVLTSFSP